MELIFKSVIDADNAPIVICDITHKVLYENKAAVEKYGVGLVGRSIMECHNEKSAEIIMRVAEWFGQSEENNKVHTFYNSKENKDVYMIALRDDNKKLIGYYEKLEYRNRDSSKLYEI